MILTGEERLAFCSLDLILPISEVVTAAVSVHLLALRNACGLTPAAAVGLGALIKPAQVAGRFVKMAGSGRHPPIWTMVAAIALIALGVGLR